MWHPFETNELYVTAMAARIADILHNAVQRDGAACMAFSSGHSPIAQFQSLNRHNNHREHRRGSHHEERIVHHASAAEIQHIVRDTMQQNTTEPHHFHTHNTPPNTPHNPPH